MARGKQTCRILKDIRRQIAEANDIELIISECQYKGDCLGTCPKCEAELRYLDEQLTLRRMAGKAIVIAGLSAGLLSLSSCSSSSNTSDNTDSAELNSCEEHLTEWGDVEEMAEVPIDTLEENADAETLSIQTNDNIEDTSRDQRVTAILVCGGDIYPDEPDFTESEDSVYKLPLLEHKPQFPDGEENMFKWIYDNLIYPEDALSQGIEGVVILDFVIDVDGSIVSPRILNNVWPSIDEEAIRIIRSMPKWTPGKRNDKIVKCTYTLPIRFRLPKD